MFGNIPQGNNNDYQKGLSQNSLEEGRAEFASLPAIVKVLPEPSAVRDMTFVILDDPLYRALYMMVNGKWQIINVISATWDDLRFPASDGKLPAVSAPDWVTYGSTPFQVLRFQTGESMFFFAQMPHEYLEGTDLEPHVHMILESNGAGSGVENISWRLDYSWANIGEGFPSYAGLQKTIDYQFIGKANQHTVHGLGTISGTGKKLSSMLMLKLTRMSVVPNYVPEVYLLELDIHFQRVNWGSIQEYRQTIQERLK